MVRSPASLTRSWRPPSSWPFSFSIAAAACSAVASSTKAKPRARPLSRSVGIETSTTSPSCAKSSRSSPTCVSKFRLPTKTLDGMASSFLAAIARNRSRAREPGVRRWRVLLGRRRTPRRLRARRGSPSPRPRLPRRPCPRARPSRAGARASGSRCPACAIQTVNSRVSLARAESAEISVAHRARPASTRRVHCIRLVD